MDDLERLEEQVGLADHLMRSEWERNQKEGASRMEASHKYWRDLGFSTRSQNCFWNEQILSIEELAQKTNEELRAMYQIGRKTINEINEILKINGLSLRHPDTGLIVSPKTPKESPWFDFCL